MKNGYQKYKETSLEYVGVIPSEWNLVPFRYICSINKGKKPVQDYQDYEEGMLPYLSMEFLRNQNANNNTVYVKNNDSSVVFVDDSDLLILWDGSKAGEIVKAKKGALSSTMAKLQLFGNSFNINFLAYYLKSCESFIQDNTIGMGIPHVNGNILRTLLIAQPNQSEQYQIVKFLDHQTSLIDEIINRKQKQIGLLKEKRQAIINETVTKGINPDAKMKDSGIEWLGEICEHLRITKLKFCCEFILDGTHGSFNRVDNGYRLLSVRNIINNEFVFREDDSRVSVEDYKSISSKFKIQENDIQLAIVGATLGKVAIVKKMSEEFVTQRSVATIRTNISKCIPKYLFYFMQSGFFQSYLWLNAGYSAQPGVYLGTIQNCQVPLPDTNEQYEIIEFLDNKISKFQSTELAINLQIEKLKEYRQSIISEAVTGKIDVRDWQPNNSSN